MKFSFFLFFFFSFFFFFPFFLAGYVSDRFLNLHLTVRTALSVLNIHVSE